MVFYVTLWNVYDSTATPAAHNVTAGGNPYIAGGQRDLEAGHESVLNRQPSAKTSASGVYIDYGEGPRASKSFPAVRCRCLLMAHMCLKHFMLL